MELENVLWMLTALAGVVVLLTRMRLHANNHQAGHAQVSDVLINVHTLVGLLALGVWVTYLISPAESLGHAAIAVGWALAIVGVMILVRWLPGGGRHAADPTDDSWAQGPFLSILGHVGMVLGVAFFTYCVLAGKIG